MADNLFSGLFSGGRTATSDIVVARQQRLAEIQAERERIATDKKVQFEQNIKRAELAIKRLSMKGIADSTWLDTYNSGFVPAWNGLNLGMKLPELQSRPQKGSDYAKRILDVWKSDEDLKFKGNAISGILLEALAEGEVIELPSTVKKALEGETPTFKIIADSTSPTGFSYQDLRNPENILPNAPAPKAAAEVSVSLERPQKTTIGKIENQMISAINTFELTDKALKGFKPEYLTYAGKGKAFIDKQLNKLGFKGSEFIKEFSAWRQDVQQQYLSYRKDITGVAVRADEKPELEIAAPSVENDAPEELKAKLENIWENQRRIVKRLKLLREQGFDEITEDILARIPLDSPQLDRQIINRGVEQSTGRAVIMYDDGSVEYAR